MKVIKHQKEGAAEVIMATNHRKIDRETAVFLNKAVKLGLEYEEEKGGVDMCEAMEKKEKKDMVMGTIKAYKFDGLSDEDIIQKVIRLYNVTGDYVLTLLKTRTT